MNFGKNFVQLRASLAMVLEMQQVLHIHQTHQVVQVVSTVGEMSQTMMIFVQTVMEALVVWVTGPAVRTTIHQPRIQTSQLRITEAEERKKAMLHKHLATNHQVVPKYQLP
jgi:hypothetical protein